MNKKRIIWLLQLAVWMIIFISPMMYVNRSYGIKLNVMLMFTVPQLSLVIVFYANYLYLAPRYLASGNAHARFWIANIMMIIILAIGSHYWIELYHNVLEPDSMRQAAQRHHKAPSIWMFVFFILRNMFNMAISAAIATTIVLTDRWQSAENARKEAESARIQAELGNLRSQINPHFLLNTLNNIYALTSFDTVRARQAIEQLSKMLRYMLYDNQEQTVNLEKEVELLRNYIALMRLRLADNVTVSFDTDLPHPCHIRVAPLIFISLVENAFKHGVSSTEPSFVRLSMTADNSRIEFRVTNSNYPKDDGDRSGHGIGLQQVARRLELTYKGRYEWRRATSDNKKEYSSKIIIYDTQLCNNR